MSLFGCACQRNFVGGGKSNNGTPSGNGAATVAPYGGTSSCVSGGGIIQGDAPFMTSPEDYGALQPIISSPVIDKRGRVTPNNQYVFRSPSAGTVQVQSPKVGRY